MMVKRMKILRYVNSLKCGEETHQERIGPTLVMECVPLPRIAIVNLLGQNDYIPNRA